MENGNGTDLAIRERDEFMPVMSIGEAINRYNAVVEFTKKVMQRDKDFGTIPGTNKPTLLKPGAEKLCTLFGLKPDFETDKCVEDWNGGFFYYAYKCVLRRGGEIVATGIGSCNSKEKKYRYRRAELKCPKCGKPAIIKGKQEYGGGFVCFGKKGGCGAKFKDNDTVITSQPQGMVENTEPFEVVNTIQKMAQKRALVAATLVATNASEFFTQDVEDMTEIATHDGDTFEGEVVEAKPQRPTQQSPPTSPEGENFLIQIDEAFDVRQVQAQVGDPSFVYTPTDRRKIRAGIAKKCKVDSAGDIPMERRRELLEKIVAGAFDDLRAGAKKEPVPV